MPIISYNYSSGDHGRMRQTVKTARIWGLLVSAAATVTEADLARFAILAEGMKGYDVTERLSKIACPVLAIGAQDDQVLGVDAAEQIAAAFDGHADFEVYLYDGYGHAAYDLAPDYKARLLQILAGRGQADREDGT